MKKFLLVSLGFIVVLGLAILFTYHRVVGVERGTEKDTSVSSVNPSIGNEPVVPPALGDGKTESARPAIMGTKKDEVTRMIQSALETLRRGNQEEIERALSQLGDLLGKGHGEVDERIAAIVEFLRTGKDSSTGHDFVVGDGGLLSEANTLRVYLIDKLGSLSTEAGSGAAQEVAREILQGFGSADEWAVSMRNVAWSDPASGEYLKDRVNAMLAHAEWRQNPTIGMLESFDVIVHTGAVSMVPDLESLITDTTSPLSRAAAVSLDRLAKSSALEFTTLMNQQTDLFAGFPLQRADLFAHANPAVPAQREQMETYLLRADVGVKEREKFYGSLIQSGQFVSNNLITAYVPPETPEQAETRLGILAATVNGWLRDSRFNVISAELTSLGKSVNRIVDEMDADVDSGDGE